MSVINRDLKHDIDQKPLVIRNESPRAVSPVKLVSVSLIVSGCLQIVLGLGCVLTPAAAAFAVEVLLGMILVFAGVAELLVAWNLRPFRGPLWFLPAACFGIAGAALLAFPMGGVMTLALVIGILFAVDGGMRLLFALQAEHQKALIAIDGLLGMITGLMILVGWPGDSRFVIGIIVGLRLMLSGFVILMTGRAMGRILPR